MKSIRALLGGLLRPVPEIPPWTFTLRCLWIVVRLLVAYCFANEVSPFFYQRF